MLVGMRLLALRAYSLIHGVVRKKSTKENEGIVRDVTKMEVTRIN